MTHLGGGLAPPWKAQVLHTITDLVAQGLICIWYRIRIS